jgi:hypothetical protein
LKLKKNQARPSKPIILNATYFGETKLAFLEWRLPFDGDATITKLTISYSASNTTTTSPLTKEFDLTSPGQTQLYSSDIFASKGFIRVKIANVFDYSDYSDEIQIELYEGPGQPPEVNGAIVASMAACVVLLTIFVVIFLRRYFV